MGLPGLLTVFIPHFYLFPIIRMISFIFRFCCNMFQNLASPGITNKNHYSAKRGKSIVRRTLSGHYSGGPGKIMLARKMEIILAVRVERSEQMEEIFFFLEEMF